MKLKGNDGVVRRFSPASCDGEYRRGVRVEQAIESECLECGERFGVHDLTILKPMFRKHVCEAYTDQHFSSADLIQEG